MIFSIEVKESANADIINAFLFYENKLPGLGTRFMDAWEDQLQELSHKPEIYQKKYKSFRQVLIKPFPYHIIYEIEAKKIVVYKVSYAGRHPRKRFIKK